MPINFDYSMASKPGVAGAKATMESADIISRLNEDATLTGFGVAVFQGAADKGATKTFALGDFVGITCIDAMAYTDIDLTEEGFATETMMSVMRRGPIWVQVAVAVAAGDEAFVTPAGAFTNAAGAGANEPVPNSRYETSTTGAGLAQLKFG